MNIVHHPEAPAPPPLKVSVAMITYNHEKFIAQAIESVLMQQTDFPIELVIGEDCSPDRTRSIALDYERQHPDRVRVLARPTNLGMLRNLTDTYHACRGQYIALLEGDDYWTDPSKLQSQVDFLDQHPDFAVCFHNALIVEDQGAGRETWCHHPPEISTAEDLACQFYIPTCSAVLRNGLIPEFPVWFHGMGMGDWPLLLLAAQHGRIRYFDKIMAHYRRHDGGIWTGTAHVRNSECLLKAVETMNAGFSHKFDALFRVREFWCWCDLALKCELDDQPTEASRYRSLARRRALWELPALLRVGRDPMPTRLKVLARLFFPVPWACLQRLRGVFSARGDSGRSHADTVS